MGDITDEEKALAALTVNEAHAAIAASRGVYQRTCHNFIGTGKDHLPQHRDGF